MTIFFICLGSSLILIGIKYLILGYLSKNWVETDAHILEGNIYYPDYDIDFATAQYKFMYEYEVEGIKYQNDLLDFGFDQNLKLKNQITTYSAGKNITIYYDVKNPQKSVVVKGIQPVMFLILGCGLIIIILSISTLN